MVLPEYISADVKKYVNTRDWDGVFVYNAFAQHSYGSLATAAGVGETSVNQRNDLEALEDALVSGSFARRILQADADLSQSGWTHEAMHTLSWYHDDARMGANVSVQRWPRAEIRY